MAVGVPTSLQSMQTGGVKFTGDLKVENNLLRMKVGSKITLPASTTITQANWTFSTATASPIELTLTKRDPCTTNCVVTAQVNDFEFGTDQGTDFDEGVKEISITSVGGRYKFRIRLPFSNHNKR